MRIKTNSWHCRLLFHMGMHIPDNLCPYFWKVVLTLTLLLVLVGIAGGCMFLMLAVPVLNYLFGGLVDPILASMILWIGAGLIIFMKVRETFEPDSGPWYLKSIYRRKPYRFKEPSLVTEYARSIHDKVCPVLEFESESHPVEISDE